METAVSMVEVQAVPVIEVVAYFRNIINERHKNPFGKKVLELGVGAVSMMPFLSSKFGEKVFRMELSDWNERNNKINDRMVQGELQCLPIASNSVDVVVCLDKINQEFDLRRVVNEIERILTAGGEALVEVPSQYFKENELTIETGLSVAHCQCVGGSEGDECHVLALRKV